MTNVIAIVLLIFLVLFLPFIIMATASSDDNKKRKEAQKIYDESASASLRRLSVSKTDVTGSTPGGCTNQTKK